MHIIVSISQFRKNIADYIEKAKQGYTVILKDEKRGQQVVELIRKKDFNPEAFGKTLKAASGVFTSENHPQWKTKKDVALWLEKERLAQDRHF